MAPKSKKNKYEQVQYQPPVPQVFGSATPEPPSVPGQFAATAQTNSFNVDVGRSRPRAKLQDRLAVYEDDNPQCQKILCIAGIFLILPWWIGAGIHLRTPTTKVLSRKA